MKHEYFTEVIEIKKGLTIIAKKGHFTIQSLCPFDIHLSFNSSSTRGLILQYRQMRDYTLDGETLYIRAAQDGQIVIEGIVCR